MAQQNSLRRRLHKELTKELEPDFIGSLEQHRDRWLASMKRAPASPFTLKAIRGETPTRSEALDCACGVSWWCGLRLAQERKDGRVAREKRAGELLESRDSLFDDKRIGCPSGVEPALWRQLLLSVRKYAKLRGWVEPGTGLPAPTDDWDETNLPEAFDVNRLVEGDPDLRALRAVSPAAFARGLAALSHLVREAESISSNLADRSSDSFLARLDAAMLRGHGFLDGRGRRSEVDRHLAVWILGTAGFSLPAQGLFLLYAGLLDFEDYTPDRPLLMSPILAERVGYASDFWSERASRNPPVTPVGLIGDLEWSAWAEHHGLARVRQMDLNTLQEQQRFGLEAPIR